jgi:hypothetical protein
MIDESGKARVWLNTDFSDNQAEDVKGMSSPISSKNEEYNMVNDIMNIVFETADESDEPPEGTFKAFYEQQKQSHDNRVGFDEARTIIFEYAKFNHIEIPEVFTSILNIDEQGEGGLGANEKVGEPEEGEEAVRGKETENAAKGQSEGAVRSREGSVIHPANRSDSGARVTEMRLYDSPRDEGNSGRFEPQGSNLVPASSVILASPNSNVFYFPPTPTSIAVPVPPQPTVLPSPASPPTPPTSTPLRVATPPPPSFSGETLNRSYPLIKVTPRNSQVMPTTPMAGYPKIVIPQVYPQNVQPQIRYVRVGFTGNQGGSAPQLPMGGQSSIRAQSYMGEQTYMGGRVNQPAPFELLTKSQQQPIAAVPDIEVKPSFDS